jgi:hypothetical protein
MTLSFYRIISADFFDYKFREEILGLSDYFF